MKISVSMNNVTFDDGSTIDDIDDIDMAKIVNIIKQNELNLTCSLKLTFDSCDELLEHINEQLMETIKKQIFQKNNRH